MRSLYELHECGGAETEFAEQFAAKWHDADWDRAERHWELLVNKLLRSSDLEGLKRRDALRTAERVAQNLCRSLLRSPDAARCPLCAIEPPGNPPEQTRPTLEPR